MAALRSALALKRQGFHDEALNSSHRYLACLALLLSTACHSALPEFAEPTSGSAAPEGQSDKDLIAYRSLTREDFRGAAPPEEMRAHAERLGALTCANLFTSPEPQYVIEQRGDDYRGHYLNLDFVARMDRGCSWWNPEPSPDTPEAYVLQHEQVHFALAEIAARRLDRDAKAVLDEVVSDSSLERVEKELRARVQDMLDDAVSQLLKRNLDFDRDTSNKYAPEVQARWFEEVSAELAASTP